MITEMLAIHNLLSQVFLWLVVGGFLLPLMTQNNALGFKKAAYIFTFTYQGIATMVAFSGLVLYVLGDYSMTVMIILMIVIWALLMYVEIKKFKVIKKANMEDAQTHSLIKSLFYKVTAVEVVLIATMVILPILATKGILSF